MASNLLFIREQLQITKKFISKLLNISVYTYAGYENGRLSIPIEILIMLSKIYNISTSDLLCKPKNISNDCLKLIEQLNKLSEKEKEATLIKNLTDGSSYNLSYKRINTIKSKILNDIKYRGVPK